MEILFRDKDLQDLYETGKSNNKFYNRLPLSVKRGFIKAYKILSVAERIEDLFQYNGLHYERLQGKNKYESVRCDKKYRLIFTSSSAEQNSVIITKIELIEINNHYDDN